MVTLLQLAAPSNPAISNVRYESGTIQLNLAQLENFYGVDDDPNSLGGVLASGGINAQIFVDGSGKLLFARIPHIWVRVNISGTDYVFDPSFKTYTRTGGIDLPTRMGYTRSAFLADALQGSTSTSTSITGLNRNNVHNDLQTYAMNLANYVRTNLPAAGVTDVIGGKSIVPTSGVLRQTSLPYLDGTAPPPTDSTTIAATFHPTLSITLPGASTVTCNSDDLYGHRMTLFFNASHQPVLRIDGNVMATGSAGVPRTQMSIPTAINVPYFTFANVNTSLNVTVDGSFLIGDGWDQVGRGMIERHRTMLAQARAASSDPTSEPVLGETLAVAGYTWLAEVAAQQRLTDQLLSTTSEYFYGVGIVGHVTQNTTTSPYVDLPLNFTNTPSRVSGSTSNGDQRSLTAFYDGSGTSSGFESGVLEQTQAQVPNFVAASTTRLLDMAAAAGDTFFDINNPAIAGDDVTFYNTTIRPQIAATDTCGSTPFIDAAVSAGFRVIAPKHVCIAVGKWTGVGFKEISPNGRSIGEIIGGGLSGGFGGVNDPAALFVLSTLLSMLLGNGGPDPFANGFFPGPFFNGGSWFGDPVDHVSGAYHYSHDDLTNGSASFPYGLALQRSYSSSAQQTSGPLGNGWTHNFAITAKVDSNGFDGTGDASPVSASSAIAALFVSSDLLNGNIGSTQNLNLLAVEAQVNRWFVDQLTGNVVSINQASGSEHFVRLADGNTYAAPLGSASTLTRNPDGTFRYTTKDGLTLTFNTDGTLSRWTNATGVVINFTYTSGNLTTVSNNVGRQLTFSYSGNLISSVSDGTGRSVSYTYTGNNLTGFRDAGNLTTMFAYDTSGAFDTAGHLTQIFYPANPTTPFVTTFYDRLGRVHHQLDGNGHSMQTFLAGTRTEVVDAFGTSQVWQLDSRGTTTREVADSGDNTHLNVTTTYNHDAQRRVTLTTFPEGQTIAFTYDNLSNPLTITTKPKPGSTLPQKLETFTYTSPVAALPNFSRVRISTDPLGNTTTNIYDANNGNLLEVDQPAVGGSTPRQTFTYSSLPQPPGQLLTVTDQQGKVTQYTYDASANRRTMTDDAGRLNLLTQYDFDPVGNLTKRTDPRGNAWTMQYDNLRRMTTITAPAAGIVVTYGYDNDGHVLQTQRANGTPTPQIFGATYSVTGKVLTATDPSGNVTTNTYDPLDRLASATDPELRVSTYAYDRLSRISQIFNTAFQAAPLAQYTYTPSGLQASITNARGITTNIQYDGFNRPSVTTFADSTTEGLSYDAAGNVLTRTQRSGQTITYTYDPLNRVSTKAPQGQPTDTYTYDLTGRIASVSNSIGAFTYGYDTAGRNTSVVSPGSRTVSYEYDADGNRTKETWPDAYFVTFAFDVMNRMTDVRQNGTTLLAHYDYDLLSRRTRLTYGNGASTTYAYQANDDLNSLVQQFNTSTSNTTTYTYNKAHQRNGQTVTDSRFSSD